MASRVQALLDKYRQDHQHPVNRMLHSMGIPMIVGSLVLMPFNPVAGGGLFVLGWILQLVGHAFEGKKPSFLSDPRFLLIGVMWFARKLTGAEPAAQDPAQPV